MAGQRKMGISFQLFFFWGTDNKKWCQSCFIKRWAWTAILYFLFCLIIVVLKLNRWSLMSPPKKRWTCLLFFNFSNRIQTVRASRMENDLANTVTQNHDIQLTVIVPSSLSLELGGEGRRETYVTQLKCGSAITCLKSPDWARDSHRHALQLPALRHLGSGMVLKSFGRNPKPQAWHPALSPAGGTAMIKSLRVLLHSCTEGTAKFILPS